MSNGIAPERVWSETCSYDTIGNAYFSRVIHTDPSRLRRLHVITSQFHIRRVRLIFNWIFSCDYDRYHLSFEATPDVGIDPDSLRARIEKEVSSTRDLNKIIPSLRSLRDVHDYMFTKHDAYRQHCSRDGFHPSTDAVETY